MPGRYGVDRSGDQGNRRPSGCDPKMLDALIRSGKGAWVRARLSRLRRAAIARPQLAEICALARRVGLAQHALRWLAPHIQLGNAAPWPASEDERAEYAISLATIGGYDEAMQLLAGISVERLPKVLLHRALTHFTQWEYESAIPLLLRYTNEEPEGTYEHRIGKLNLAAAYIYRRSWQEAEPLLEEVRREALDRGERLLHGNVLELAAQLALARRQWDRALGLLDAAAEALREASGPWSLFVRKWRVFLPLLKGGPSEAALGEWASFRREMKSVGQWEIVRQCDRVKAITCEDDDLLLHLCAGTPFPAFRRRLLEDSGLRTLPAEYRWHLGEGGEPKLVVDLASSRAVEAGAEIVLGHTAQRILSVLTTDFYLPFRIGRLFAALYPGERFDPFFSPNRVHSLLRHFRRWCSAVGVPLLVSSSASGYRLQSTSPCTIRLSIDPGQRTKEQFILEELRRMESPHGLSVREVERCLKLPRRTVQRLLQRATTSGTLKRSGRGPLTRYHFARGAE